MRSPAREERRRERHRSIHKDRERRTTLLVRHGLKTPSGISSVQCSETLLAGSPLTTLDVMALDSTRSLMAGDRRDFQCASWPAVPTESFRSPGRKLQTEKRKRKRKRTVSHPVGPCWTPECVARTMGRGPLGSGTPGAWTASIASRPG